MCRCAADLLSVDLCAHVTSPHAAPAAVHLSEYISEVVCLLCCSHDKVYVEVKDLEQAMQAKTAVQAHDSIKADQRTNSWTVCLTCVGFADYLNRKMGPLGESPTAAALHRLPRKWSIHTRESAYGEITAWLQVSACSRLLSTTSMRRCRSRGRAQRDCKLALLISCLPNEFSDQVTPQKHALTCAKQPCHTEVCHIKQQFHFFQQCLRTLSDLDLWQPHSLRLLVLLARQ